MRWIILQLDTIQFLNYNLNILVSFLLAKLIILKIQIKCIASSKVIVGYNNRCEKILPIRLAFK